MNDLVDHDFTELEFFVILAVANVLSNNGDAFVVIAEALAAVERAAFFLVVTV